MCRYRDHRALPNHQEDLYHSDAHQLFTNPEITDPADTATLRVAFPTIRPAFQRFQSPLTSLLLLTALLLSACDVRSQPAPGSIEFEYEIDWQTLGNRRILFKTDTDGNFDLYVADGYSDQLRHVTDDIHYNKYADPSPDGTRVVYSSNRDGGDFDLFVVNLDGTGLRQLTANDIEDYSPTWSPDGRQIAYEANDNFGALFQIYVVDTDGANKRQITSDLYHNYAPDWSPDGRTVSVFSDLDRNFDIYTLDIASGERRLIANDNAYAHFSDFSPDGSTIAYQSNPRGDWDLYRVDAAGDSEPHRLTFSIADDMEPDWSAEGQEILFTSSRDGDFNIYLMAADGTDIRPLISTSGRDTQPVWIPGHP